ncbi:MAG: HIT family protein [Crenarchaeota archaeon]|nr:HIT family protein [Thermoproteota archaeon]
MSECVFCRIVRGELPSWKVYEDEEVMAFLDINPATPGHTLVIPKKHYRNILDAPDEVVAKVFKVAKKISEAVVNGLGAKGVNVITNAEEVAGQVVFHFHVHVVPRYSPDELRFEYTPKKYSEEEAEEIVKKIKSSLG